MSANISEFIEEYKVLMGKAQETLREKFGVYVKEFFSNNPEIKTIKWVQYTPYFNDGDACEFRVNDPVFSNCPNPDAVSVYGDIDDNEDEQYWASAFWEVKYLKDKLHDTTVENMDEFSSIICSSAMEGVLFGMFGDHAEITCTENGFEVDEYQHD